MPGLLARLRPEFSSECAVCRSWPAHPVCGPCVARFASPAPRCGRCALALPADLSMGLRTGPPLCGACAVQPPPLDCAVAGVDYAYPWSTLIAGYKFGGQHGWAGFFAGLLLQSPGAAQVFADLRPQDWVLPMPLATHRLQTRGFNQAWELCAELARQTRTQARTDAGLLLRVRHTRPQSQLKRKERLANVKGVFQVDPLRAAQLQGRRIVLVDDVMTSGASIYTAAQVLREAGAAHVTAVILARTAPA
ncbi:ComF family protein [Polaromonas sp. SP1]|nr:ComF family protein [Polaromonas sp. SP1]QGJ20759.1 ComF family protein [Polaromonas sp. Pch-P]